MDEVVRAFRMRYHHNCFYCGCELIKRAGEHHKRKRTMDHLRPLSRGGLAGKKNKVPCCYPCNKLKDDLPLEDFRKLIFGDSSAKFFFETTGGLIPS